MERLYENMKAALDLFGLRFQDMKLVSCEVKADCIVFYYGGKAVSISSEALNERI